MLGAAMMDVGILEQQRAAEDAERFKSEMREAVEVLGKHFHHPDRVSWHFWTVTTSKGEWRYRYCTQRNKAGFFLGEIVFYAKPGNRSVRGLFARRTKKRVMEMQRDRAQKHRERIKRGR